MLGNVDSFAITTPVATTMNIYLYDDIRIRLGLGLATTVNVYLYDDIRIMIFI